MIKNYEKKKILIQDYYIEPTGYGPQECVLQCPKTLVH